MTFEHHVFWKHERLLDSFFQIIKIEKLEGAVKLTGFWCTQGIYNWWYSIDGEIKVPIENIKQWKPYTPKGELKK